MANRKLTDLTELLSPADGDFLYVVDVSDTTESPAGTSKKIKKQNVLPAVSNTFTVTDFYVVTPGTQDFEIPVGELAFLVMLNGSIQFLETANNTDEFNLYGQIANIVTLKDTTATNNYIYILSR